MQVFVYGTLKSGHGNHRLLQGSKFLGRSTVDRFKMYSLGGFPAVVPSEDGVIQGEVYEVDDFTMTRLDRLEGYPNFYDRMIVSTEKGPAWIYYMHTPPREDKSIIPNGVW